MNIYECVGAANLLHYELSGQSIVASFDSFVVSISKGQTVNSSRDVFKGALSQIQQ